MPSHLTRVVFRRLIANEPLLYHGCRYSSTRPRLTNQHSARSLPHIQQRTFFDLFKQKRKLKAAEAPAGLETLSELHRAQKTGVRPPKPKDVAEAFRAFFAQRKGTFEGFHIARAHKAFEYLLENPQENGQPWFSKEELDADIYRKLVNPAKRPIKLGEEHLKFGRALLQEMARNENNDAKEVESETNDVKKMAVSEDLSKMLNILCMFGAAQEARTLVVRTFEQDSQATPAYRSASKKAWNQVFAGIASEGQVEEMLKTIQLFQDSSHPLSTSIQRHLVTFFATRNDLQRAKYWYSQPLLDKFTKKTSEPLPSTSATLLKACALSGDLAFGQQVVASLLKGDLPGKGSWDAIFLWSAAIGKGVDEVDRMMGVMVRRNDEARQKNPAVEVVRPDADTINTLVEFSMSKQDPYTAERYIALGEKRGIPPNEKTYAMQIQYRLSVKDLDGARAAYFNMQGEFSGAEQSVSVINLLIRALCESKQPHFDELMNMVDDLHERKAQFDPETVASICVLHLQRGETHDAMDLLQVHAHQFTPEQRTVIQKGLLAFMLDGETSTADAWDSYQILRNVFPETPREDRVQVMNDFFARKRPDMSCHVFFHMRNHISEAHSATREVYIAAFTGFARCADAESLELAHNQLKLDFKIEYNTQLRNALMLAYASVEEHTKALQFWREICESKEGPTYNSIAIAFRSCEGMHFGHEHARSIWKRLQEQEVEIDKTIWIAYMSALARNHQHEEALGLIESVEEEYGFKPDLAMYVDCSFSRRLLLTV